MWLICFLVDEWLLQKLSILKDQKVCVYMCVCVVQCLYVSAICAVLKDGIAVCVYH